MIIYRVVNNGLWNNTHTLEEAPWQVVQKSKAFPPLKTRRSDLSSPLDSMCLAPGPWQPWQRVLPSDVSPLWAAIGRKCGLRAKDLPMSSWQSLQRVDDSAAGAAAGVVAGVVAAGGGACGAAVGFGNGDHVLGLLVTKHPDRVKKYFKVRAAVNGGLHHPIDFEDVFPVVGVRGYINP